VNLSKPVPEMSSSDIVRFCKKIQAGEASECWPWKAGAFKDGYGAFRVRVAHGVFRQVIATRIAFKLWTGVDPVGMLVCHTCDNPSCCNPNHLFLGTSTTNERDKIAKKRRPRLLGTRSGVAKLTDASVVTIRSMAAVGLNHKSIAEHFGVDRSTISLAVRGKTWEHVQCA